MDERVEDVALSLEELERAVGGLLDRQAIYDCVMAYSRGVDRLDREALLSVYHKDAVDDHGVFIGTAEQFADWALPMHAAKHLTHQHCLFNHTAEIDGDVAHAETYYMFVGINATATPVFVQGGGRYIDRLERRDGRWAIAARKCVRDWAPLTERPDSVDQAGLTAGRSFMEPEEYAFLATCSQTTRDRGDPVYERPLTIDPARLRLWRELHPSPAAGADTP